MFAFYKYWFGGLLVKIDLYQNFLNAISIHEEQTRKENINTLFTKYASNFKQNLSGQFMLIYGKDIKKLS